VADLEQRCRRAEAENKQLRRELLAARAGVPTLTNPQIAEVSSELIHNLSLASASINRLQNIIFSESPGASLSGSDQPTKEVLGHLRAATFPSTIPTHPYSQTVFTTPVGESFPEDNHTLSRPRQRSPPSQNLLQSSYRHRSPSSGSECCGGIFDCHDLIEKDVTHDVQQYSPIGRLSDLRSTFDIPMNDLP